MEEDFNLIYYHRETGKVYWVKRVTRIDVVIMDPETRTKLPLSQWALSKSFIADKTNFKRRKKKGLNFKKYKEKND